MNDIYTDEELEPLLLAIKKLIKSEIAGSRRIDLDYAVSNLFELVVFFELGKFEESEEVPRSNNPLWKAILKYVGSEDIARAVYHRVISWESWIWDQKKREDLEEEVFWAEQNDGIYGTPGLNNPSEYGAEIGPFDGVFELGGGGDGSLGIAPPVASLKNPEILSLIELHLRGQHNQKSHGGCGPVGCNHLDISSEKLAGLRDGRENALRSSGKGVKFLPTTVWDGPAPKLNKRATWKSSSSGLSAEEKVEIGRKHQGVAVVRVSDGAYLDPNPADTSHAQYQIHQVGLESLIGDGDFLDHLVRETEPVTVELWESTHGYNNAPMRTYTVPGTSSFLLGIALRPDGTVATLVPLRPTDSRTLQRRDSRVMVDALTRQLGSEPKTKIINIGGGGGGKGKGRR